MLARLVAVLCVASAALAAPFVDVQSRAAAAVKYPLHTSDRWILDANNQRVKLRCANWVGHLEVNIPEGLHYQTPAYIASWLSRNNFNCVRLTYSIDLALNPNYSVKTSFSNAASKTGASGLNGLYTTAVAKNSWLASSTTLGAFTQVIQALAAQNIMVLFDDQMSSAGWCCSLTDGNGWWNDGTGTATSADSQYFDVNNWMNGLKAMATYAKSFPNVIGMSIRNELRSTSSGTAVQQDWATHVKAAAQAIYQANPNLLITVGGISYDLDLSWLYNTPLDRSTFANRVVWEVHWYSWSYSSTACSSLETSVGNNAGYLLASNKAYTGPLWLSEWGLAQVNPTATETAYLQCVVAYTTSNDMEWAIWGLQGSYYVRNGQTNFVETFGVLKPDWSDWQNSTFSGALGNMWKQTQGP